MFGAVILTGIFLFQSFQLSKSARIEVVDSTVQGNLSDSQTLRFRYSLDSSDDPNSILLQCGYYIPNNFQVVVRKAGVTGQLTSQLSRFDPYVDPSNPNILGFTIRDIRRDDARDYFCLLDFVQSGRPIDKAKSLAVKFEVLLRPEWFNDDCLRDFDPVIREGEDLRIKCVVIGFPTPLLQCMLLKFNGELVDGFNRIGPEMANFTTRSFGRIPKESRRIMCQATTFNSVTGVLTKVVDMPSQFEYSPFPVRHFEVFTRTARSIQLRWLPIMANETNPPLQHYAIEYYIEDLGTANLTRKRVAVFAPNNPSRDNIFIYDTLENLAPFRKYIITIFGVNSFREGQSFRLPGSVLVSQSASGSSATNAAVIGGVVGGVIGFIILAIIVVVLVIFCSKKKETKTHYPTSYVEDAVDYPNQGGLGGYAPVAKGKPKRQASPAGYPDVVGGSDKKQLFDNDTSPAYEMSNKAFV